MGDPDGGLEELEASLATFRALGDPWETAETLNLLATLTRDRGDHAAALRGFEECLALYRQVGDRRGEGSALQAPGNMALGEGDYARARAWSTQSLALMGALGHRDGTTISLGNLALGALLQGRLELARLHGEELLALGRDQADSVVTAFGRCVFATLALAERDHQRARAGFGEALALTAGGSRSGGAEPAGVAWSLQSAAVAWALQGFAALAAAERRATRAVRLATAAEAAGRYEHGGGPGPLAPARRRLFDSWLGPARHLLSEPARAAAEAEGRAMTREQAASYALEDAPEVAAPPTASDGAAPGGLTPREREVTVLVARGYSNPQIARELVIAPRTAMRHVEHVMAKLGVHSRAEIGAWAAQHGLLETGGA
jgi:DNA-binding CsgD family transcriptional regulator